MLFHTPHSTSSSSIQLSLVCVLKMSSCIIWTEFLLPCESQPLTIITKKKILYVFLGLIITWVVFSQQQLDYIVGRLGTRCWQVLTGPRVRQTRCSPVMQGPHSIEQPRSTHNVGGPVSLRNISGTTGMVFCSLFRTNRLLGRIHIRSQIHITSSTDHWIISTEKANRL